VPLHFAHMIAPTLRLGFSPRRTLVDQLCQLL
jgi:hypothetical protein